MSARKGAIHDFIRGWNVTKTQGEMLVFTVLWGGLSLLLIVAVLSVLIVGKGSSSLERHLYYAWVEAKNHRATYVVILFQ